MKTRTSGSRRGMLCWVWLSAVAVLAPAGGIQAAITLTLPEAAGSPGAVVKVPIAVQGAKGCGAIQFDLTYDPSVLEAKEAEEGAVLGGAMLTSNVARPGCLKVALISQQPLAGDGELAVAVFSVKTSGACPLGLVNARAWDHASNLDMLVSVAPGRFAAAGGGGATLWIVLACLAGAVVLVVAVILRRKRTTKPA